MTTTVRPIPPGPELAKTNKREFAHLLKLHYQIVRHHDEMVEEEMRACESGQRTGTRPLLNLIARRDKAQKVYLQYLQEACRRADHTSTNPT